MPDPQLTYSDSLTYDITAWSIPYAYGLKAVAAIKKLKLKQWDKILPLLLYQKMPTPMLLSGKVFPLPIFIRFDRAGIRVFYNSPRPMEASDGVKGVCLFKRRE